MLSSISPVGEHSRNQRWWLTATAYLVGSLMGGAAMGALAGGAGQLLLSQVSLQTRLILIGAAAAVGVVFDLTSGVPTVHRQVDERWLTTYRGWVYGAGFGLQLGTGVVTIMPSSIVAALWVGTAFGTSLSIGMGVGLAFGAARALPLILAGRIRTVSALRRTLAWMDTVSEPVRRSIPVAQGVTAIAAVGLALR